jgi:hypothetical protein
MSLIQLILLSVFIFALVLYFSVFRSDFRDRLLILIIFKAAVVAVIFPNLTVSAAKFVGVGRGTDLLIYLYICASLFAFLVLYSKIERVRRIHTDLARSIAISAVKKPNEHK